MSSSASRRSRAAARLRAALTARWYSARSTPPLVPLALAYGGLAAARRAAYRHGWRASLAAGVPVIVVGNITVGGSGKTPLCIALAEKLAARGRRVGVVLRGYGGRARRYPLAVDGQTEAAAAGDEAVLIARRTAARVVVDPDRARGARALAPCCDVIVADDGLQHYRLRRDAEIAVVDGQRRHGNGRLLPAGPLREPIARLAAVDLCLTRGADFELVAEHAVRLADGQRRPLAEFAAARVDALAGIADPDRLFVLLRSFGIDCSEHRLPDHAPAPAAAFGPSARRALLMTEKDAVKWPRESPHEAWYVPVTTRFDPAAEARVERLLDNVLIARVDRRGSA